MLNLHSFALSITITKETKAKIKLTQNTLSQLTRHSTYAWFNFTCYHAHLPMLHTPPPPICNFFSFLVVYSPPRACRRRQFPTPKLLIDLIITRFFGVHLYESKSDFQAICILYCLIIKLVMENINYRG